VWFATTWIINYCTLSWENITKIKGVFSGNTGVIGFNHFSAKGRSVYEI
jgi:hypothetical protein